MTDNVTMPPASIPAVIPEVPKKKGRGRPSKAELAAATKKIGRPKNDTGRIAEFKARLLATSGTSVIDKVLSIAENDNHPGQMAALKMCMDRMLPVSLFEKGANGRPQVQINIVNATDPNNNNNVVIDVGGIEDEENNDNVL
jgi:hypothetical protein